jgi:hypothetical protein
LCGLSLGKCSVGHGQGQRGSSSGSDSELLHTSNSCFSGKSADCLFSRLTGDIANAVPTLKQMQIPYKSTTYKISDFSKSCKMHELEILYMQVAGFE